MRPSLCDPETTGICAGPRYPRRVPSVPVQTDLTGLGRSGPNRGRSFGVLVVHAVAVPQLLAMDHVATARLTMAVAHPRANIRWNVGI